MRQPPHARLAILLTAAAMVALGVAFVWLHLATPSDGARLAPGQNVWRSDGVLITLLRQQPDGLRSGDLVVAVDGTSMESWAQSLLDPSVSRPQWQAGHTITYTVVRDGVTMDLPITLRPYPMDAIWQEGWSTILYALVFAFIALYIVLRRPGEQAPLVLLLCASGILAATTWTFGLQVSDLVGGVGFWLYKATTSICYLLFYIAALHFALIFPRPHAVLARRPRLIWALYATPFLLDLIYIVATRQQTPSTLDWLGRLTLGENVLVTFLVLAITAALIWNYRSNRDPDTRKKIRWMIFGGLVSIISGLLLWNLPGAVLSHPLISANALGLLVLPFPIAIAIAVLRHQLFDIDTILNRTLVYGALTAIVIAAYVLIVSALGALFHTSSNLLVSLVATGIIAVLFQPLRLWLQRGIDRLMFGQRDDPYAVLSRLSQRLETTLAPDTVLPTIVETVAHALKLPSVAIAIKDGQHLTPAAQYGVPIAAHITFPLVYQSELLGELHVSPRAPDEPFTEADKRLLKDIAHQTGIAVHATRLTADLQRSRARLVTAREEERRRIRRDLHDSIGPTLAGMTLKVGAIRNLLTHDPTTADHLLAELGAEIAEAIADIRRLVYALRPPALDELGLVAAVRAHAVQYQPHATAATDDANSQPGLRVTIDAPPNLPPLPAAVEVAAYRITCEALNNIVRHAHAHTCHITLALDTALHVEIADDGVGIAPERQIGVGLVSMRERAEELGGTCAVAASPGHGSRILVALPLAKE
ncbi:MAG: Two-component system sensor histidine kinase [Ktedonobacterales bacterium]|jgi:signal transduction histidine kinase|nr:MAG: Two-component system sensor histidine kinase [Ktedonobacterales bacterium]